jgi:hypothetical protein
MCLISLISLISLGQPELRTIVCTAIGWVIYDMTNEPDQPDQPDQPDRGVSRLYCSS